MKDVKRQKEIENYLKCDFLRIKEDEIKDNFFMKLSTLIKEKE